MTATTATNSSTNLQASSISSRGFVRLAVAQPVLSVLGLIVVILLVVIPEGMR